MKRDKKVLIALLWTLLTCSAFLWFAGCGGAGSSAVHEPGATTAPNITRNVMSTATATVMIPDEAKAVQKPTPSVVRTRAASSVPAGTLRAILPVVKAMSYQNECAAYYFGRDRSVRTQYLWLAMAVFDCWDYSILVQFDLSGLAGINSDDIVLAELEMYQYSDFGHHESSWMYDFEASVLPVSGTWDESTTWFFNRPATEAGFPDNRITVTNETGWKNWDVTDAVKAWHSGVLHNYGFNVFPHNAGMPLDSNAFFYDETGGAAFSPPLSPRLVVYYKEPAPPVTTVMPPPGTCVVPSAPGVQDADANDCVDSIYDLHDLIKSQGLDKRLTKKLLRKADKALKEYKKGKKDKALKELLKLYNEIEKHRGDKKKDIPGGVADMLEAYIENVMHLI